MNPYSNLKNDMVKESWKTISKWVESSSSKNGLPDGVSSDQIKEAEQQMCLVLPDDLKEVYRIHNGSSLISFFDFGYLMPLFIPLGLSKQAQNSYQEIVSKWKWYKEYLDEGVYEGLSSFPVESTKIKSDHWNRKWIPITDNMAGDQLCIDLDPEIEGTYGQVIAWDHEAGATKVIAPSFQNWLEDLALQLESDMCVFDEVNYGTITLRSKI